MKKGSQGSRVQGAKGRAQRAKDSFEFRVKNKREDKKKRFFAYGLH